MRVGFKTRLLGHRISDLPRLLDGIAEAGFDGVEFSQHPSLLGCKDFSELQSELAQRKLALIGLTCGSLRDRVAFLNGADCGYLTVKAYHLSKPDALSAIPYLLAIHPGIFSPVRTLEETLRTLAQHPQLKLIFDAAHMAIMGEHVTDSFAILKDHIVSVHLKDWRPDHGRLGQRYSRGFTDLGKGVANIAQLISHLQEAAFPGWAVLECEKTGETIARSLLPDLAFLAAKGLLKGVPADLSKFEQDADSRVTSSGWMTFSSEADFQHELTRSAIDHAGFYRRIASAIRVFSKCDYVMLWAYLQGPDRIALVECNPAGTVSDRSSDNLLDPREVLTGVAMDRQLPFTAFDLTSDSPAADYGSPECRFAYSTYLRSTGLRLRRLVSVPIYNDDHQNYVRMVANLYYQDQELPGGVDDVYRRISKHVGEALDTHLDRACLLATSRISLLATQRQGQPGFVKEISQLVNDIMNAEETQVFLENGAQDQMQLIGVSGESSTVLGIGIVSHARNELNDICEVWRSAESRLNVPNAKLRASASAIAPIVTAGNHVVGIVCSQRKRDTPSGVFSAEDMAVLDAVCQALAPHMQIVQSNRHRTQSLNILTHELSNPVSWIRGAVDCIKQTPGVSILLKEDWCGDILEYTDLMNVLISSTSLLRQASDQVVPRIRRRPPVRIKPEVIAPAVRHVRPLLRDDDLVPSSITYYIEDDFPTLFIDVGMFRQVTFNLLKNAIKYRFADRSQFAAEILGQERNGDVELVFRDFGIGIEPENREAIFLQGKRTERAIGIDPYGQGIGLWISRQILRAHGGDLVLQRPSMPTEFVARLPGSLKHMPPANSVMIEGRRKSATRR